MGSPLLILFAWWLVKIVWILTLSLHFQVVILHQTTCPGDVFSMTELCFTAPFRFALAILHWLQAIEFYFDSDARVHLP